MKNLYITVLLAGLAIISYSPTAHASMRCLNGIISNGATTFEVLHKCGEPGSKEKISPALASDGKAVNNSVTVEHWMYGPNNRMYRFLKFVDRTLVKIESRL